MRQLLAAARYAACAHAQQRRKGGDIPYVNHLIDVAARLAEAHPEDEALAIAGLLHDVVEDQCDWQGRDPALPGVAARRAEIAELFGEDVLRLVDAATDDKRMDKQARKRAQIDHAAGHCARAKRLKLADKASNLSVMVPAPECWSRERKAEYLDWAERVGTGLKAGAGSRALEAGFDAALAGARERLSSMP